MGTAEKWRARGAVLDAFAVLLWLWGVGADEVRQWLEGASAGALRLFISVINLGEVYYRLVRLGKKADADAFWRELMRGEVPVAVVPATARRVREAAEIKGRYPIAYADAFAAQLALELGLPLLRGDPGFRELERGLALDVRWLPMPLMWAPRSDVVSPAPGAQV